MVSALDVVRVPPIPARIGFLCVALVIDVSFGGFVASPFKGVEVGSEEPHTPKLFYFV